MLIFWFKSSRFFANFICINKHIEGGFAMTIVRWDPFRNMATLQDRINRVFDEAVNRSKDYDDEVSTCNWRPVVDIYDSEKAIIINAELPGVTRENITLDVKENALTLKGERKAEEEVQKENYYRMERCFGTFERAFTLPSAVDPGKITANFKDGILRIEIPKPEEKRPKQISINVE
jgi:HSP20 family protein